MGTAAFKKNGNDRLEVKHSTGGDKLCQVKMMEVIHAVRLLLQDIAGYILPENELRYHIIRKCVYNIIQPFSQGVWQ